MSTTFTTHHFYTLKHAVAWCTYDKSIQILDYKEKVSVYDGLELMWEWLQKQPQRPSQYFDKYELDKKVYSYWKLK